MTQKSFKQCNSCKQEKDTSLFLSRKGYGVRGTCKECHRVKEKARREASREDYNKQAMLRYEKNKEQKKALMKKYYLENKQKIKLRRKEWVSKNLAKIVSDNKKRVLSIRQRIPPWTTSEMLEQIKQEYELAAWASKAIGVKFHVDHIIPINGVNVSGLHVPLNLRVITASQNISKKNKIDSSLVDSW